MAHDARPELGDLDPAAIAVEATGDLSTVPAAAWDGLANPGWRMDAAGAIAPLDPSAPPSVPFNPFLSHTFLVALEEAGSVGEGTGWYPRHLLVRDADGTLLGAAPAYLKTHSRGEYVFDYGWAHAFERAGGRYYPKLQVAVPFTPVPGPRLLAGAGPEAPARRALLGEALKALADTARASSVHVTFASEADCAALATEGWLERHDNQFHWENEGYETFDDFLAALASRKRKQLRRERRDALSNGISVEWVTGSEITEAHWDDFFAFYMDTGARKWGMPYLNREFFSLLGERMAGRVALVFAVRGGRRIAGALNLVGSDTLYGRYWGCLEEHPFLHFEICYYQAIDYALAHGLSRVEAGAQGQHKLARGYVPKTTRSAHFIMHPGLRDAVARFLEQERTAVEEEQELLSAFAPFRKGA